MMKLYKNAGMALISIVISLLIGALVIIIALSVYKGGSKTTPEEIEKPINRAARVQCISRIRQIETEIAMYRAEHGTLPARLEDLENLSDEVLCCPVTNEPYHYDPNTGKVSCPTHGQ
jgi:hypothetical protein